MILHTKYNWVVNTLALLQRALDPKSLWALTEEVPGREIHGELLKKKLQTWFSPNPELPGGWRSILCSLYAPSCCPVPEIFTPSCGQRRPAGVQ